MAAAADSARGLTAAELGQALAELQPLVGTTVLDVVVPAATDDLVLVLQDDGGRKHFLHAALGGGRARLCTTARRWPKDACARGPGPDALRLSLAGARLLRLVQAAGERRAELHLRTAHGEQRLVLELFSARGLWALLDAEGRVQQLSRPVTTAVRTLGKGSAYAPPPPGLAREEPASRFPPPVLAAIDAHFTALDLQDAAVTDHEQMLGACHRALQKLDARIAGIRTQLADTGRVAALRAEADLLLAYAHTYVRGMTAMVVPDPERDGEQRTLELRPDQPPHVQAEARYQKARRLEDGVQQAEQRLAAAEAERQAVLPLQQALQQQPPGRLPAAELEALRAALAALGVLPKPRPAAPAKQPGKAARPGENFRQFVSAEGYPILVGRNNEQNDVLTLRVANGNDLWLHVGGGRPGSHVVIRLPKNKTASLESLLDAGTLAVHFSKARGERRIDVVYTQRKHVRKPKGLPAGAVVPSRTRTLTVQLDEARLRRLLDSAAADDRDG